MTLLTQEDEVAVHGLGGGLAQLVRQHLVAVQRAHELAGRRAVTARGLEVAYNLVLALLSMHDVVCDGLLRERAANRRAVAWVDDRPLPRLVEAPERLKVQAHASAMGGDDDCAGAEDVVP